MGVRKASPGDAAIRVKDPLSHRTRGLAAWGWGPDYPVRMETPDPYMWSLVCVKSRINAWGRKRSGQDVPCFYRSLQKTNLPLLRTSFSFFTPNRTLNLLEASVKEEKKEIMITRSDSPRPYPDPPPPSPSITETRPLECRSTSL